MTALSLSSFLSPFSPDDNLRAAICNRRPRGVHQSATTFGVTDFDQSDFRGVEWITRRRGLNDDDAGGDYEGGDVGVGGHETGAYRNVAQWRRSSIPPTNTRHGWQGWHHRPR